MFYQFPFCVIDALTTTNISVCHMNFKAQTRVIFLQIAVDSVHDPKVGVVFDPKSLIQALVDLIGRHMTTNVMVV